MLDYLLFNRKIPEDIPLLINSIAMSSGILLYSSSIILTFIISEKQVNNMEEEGIRFYIGDQLPIRYDVAMAITSVCPSPSRAGREVVIHKYGVALHLMWRKAFGKDSFGNDHVVTLKTVKERIESLMKDYDTKCYKASSKGRRDDNAAKPLRVLNRKWRFETVPVKKNTLKKKIKVQTNNDLFDIGKNMETLEGDKEVYYQDQSGSRIFRLSERIDEEYEEHVQTMLTNEAEEASLVEAEQSFSNPSEFNESIPIKDRKVHGKKTVMVDRDVQVDDINPCPEIRKGRNALPKVKDNCNGELSSWNFRPKSTSCHTNRM